MAADKQDLANILAALIKRDHAGNVSFTQEDLSAVAGMELDIYIDPTGEMLVVEVEEG
ncbi:MAG TPA: hypothetical protein VFG06_11015 [Thermodesulfovibrionales bacterium]|nr:hypothetical protein [Thermodesulfovibrionales bacterium]